MKLLFDLNKEKLNGFASAQAEAEFLQSYEWGRFQEYFNEIIRIGVEEGGELVAVATFIKKPLLLGKSYLYCPRGPFVKHQVSGIKYQEILDFFYDELKKISRQKKIIFLRFEPKLEIRNLKLEIEPTISIQPKMTSIVDLSKSEEEIMKQMHQKTRYNIRLAEKKGVVIREAKPDEFDKFWSLMSQTGDRDGFRLHGKEYYKQMIRSEAGSRKSEMSIRLFFAEYGNSILAAGVFAFFGDTVTYMHGASSNENRNFMGPYLLHWKMIGLAKAQGYKYYDLFGIDEIKWPGVTRFKQGFGGREKIYAGTFDAVFAVGWYRMYNWLRGIRRKI